MEKKQISIDELKSMAWEIHDNWTDGNRKDSDDDSQCLYKSYQSGDLYVTYTEECGYEANFTVVDGEDEWDASDIANELDCKLNDRLDDLDTIYERYHAEQDVA